MAKFLNLNGFIGPRAEDSIDGEFIDISEEIAELIYDAISEGSAVTTDLSVKEMTSEVSVIMVEALKNSEYLARKIENLAVIEKSKVSTADKLQALLKSNNGKGN